MTREITSKNIQGVADLVISAPIRQGFIDAYQDVTYETRLRLAIETFHKLRVAAREHELIKPFTDVAERIQALLAFRIGIMGPESQRRLFLAVTFDRAWEPYMRLVWRPLGVFLDVLLCNCEGYVTAGDHSFAEYAQWVRASQVDSAIFYATTPLTVGDQLYLSKLDRLQRTALPVVAGTDMDLAMATMTADDPENLAKEVRESAQTDPYIQAEFLTMATEALVVLYRLADFYPPDDLEGDGKYLLRVAKDLFQGWDTTDKKQLPRQIRDPHEEMFGWLEQAAPPPPLIPADPWCDDTEVQAGILSSFDRKDKIVRHGCLLLLGVGRGVDDAKKARTFIADHFGMVSWEGAAEFMDGFLNVAITCQGLASLGVPADVVGNFPKEFREGPQDRAGLIGDIRENHPRRWRLPPRFRPVRPKPSGGDEDLRDVLAPVEMSEIDIVIQLCTTRGDWDYIDLPNSEEGLRKQRSPRHPLADAVLALLGRASDAGVTLLSIQPMRRIQADQAKNAGHMQDHFGFLDFISQPALKEDANTPKRDVVKRGELVLGYGNDRGDPPLPPDRYRPFLKNGSFLVIRKIRQDVKALEDFIAKPPGANPAVTGGNLLAKMMGRYRDGTTVLSGGTSADNDFNYAGDADGTRCPFQAHIRRANPRLSNADTPQPPFGRPTPRIMRRGMSYGPTLEEARRQGKETDDRGVVFMAYNASIAEQYEVIQRWINGGNSTAVAAAQNDPLTGVQPAIPPNTFRFANGAGVVRVDIPPAVEDKPGGFVGLEWGLYLFVPSKKALLSIAASEPDWPILGDRARGEEIVNTLLHVLPEDARKLAWKTYMEDFGTKDPAESCDTPDVWAALRGDAYKGALRIPQAVLTASDTLINWVLMDPDKNYTVREEAKRMAQSFGEIYIGLDAGPQYDRESTDTNNILMSVKMADAFKVAHDAAEIILNAIFKLSDDISNKFRAPYPAEIDLCRDFITPTLGLVCKFWFGIPELPSPGDPPAFFDLGDWSWESPHKRKPRCPGDFMSPSRYCFYPDPTDAISRYGKAHGQALRAAALDYFNALRPDVHTAPTAKPTAPIALAMFDAITDNELLARTLIGVMVGALPPMDGNLRAVLYDWVKEKSLWRYQQALLSTHLTPFAWAMDALLEPMTRAMQKRPAPDLLWRTAAKPHRLGEVDVAAGEKVILSITSATMEKQNAKQTGDVYTVFGGNRRQRPHPVHACPAYDMAIGTMLGILTALFEVEQIEALPAPQLVKLTPRSPAPAPESRTTAPS